MTEEYVVEQAVADHRELLVPLFEAFRVGYPVAPDPEGVDRYLYERLEKKDSLIYFAKSSIGGAAVGFVQLFPAYSTISLQKYWRLHDLYVADEYRKKGISKLLLAHCKTQLKKKNVPGILIETRITGKSAVHFFDEVIFKKEGDHLYYFLE